MSLLPRCLPIVHESDIAVARKHVRDVARELGMSETNIEALATAVPEISWNIGVRGKGGEPEHRMREGKPAALVVEASDQGPGIQDIARAMEDGYTSGAGLGLGLAGAQRLVDLFEIVATPGAGTRVKLTKLVDRRFDDER